MPLMAGTTGPRPAVLAGAFVALFAAVVAVWLVVRIGVGVVQTRHTIVLEEVSGLEVGADVLVAGYRIGRVDGIEPVFPELGAADATAETAADPEPVAIVPVEEAAAAAGAADPDAAATAGDDCVIEGGAVVLREADPTRVHFVVTFSVDAALGLPEDSLAVLSSPSPLGAPVIDLRLGAADAVVAPGGRLLAAVEPSALDGLGEVAGGLGPMLRSALTCIEQDIDRELRAITAEMDQFLAGLQVTIDGELATIRESVQGTLGNVEANVGELIDPLAAVATDTAPLVEQAIADLSAAASNIAQLGSADTVEQAERALDAATSALISAREAMIAAAPALDNLNAAITQVAPDTVAIAADSQYVLQQLAASLNVTLLNLESASQELAGLIADIRANPAVLLTGRGEE